jgi:hypothetical protein
MDRWAPSRTCIMGFVLRLALNKAVQHIEGLTVQHNVRDPAASSQRHMLIAWCGCQWHVQVFLFERDGTGTWAFARALVPDPPLKFCDPNKRGQVSAAFSAKLAMFKQPMSKACQTAFPLFQICIRQRDCLGGYVKIMHHQMSHPNHLQPP